METSNSIGSTLWSMAVSLAEYGAMAGCVALMAEDEGFIEPREGTGSMTPDKVDRVRQCSARDCS